MNGAGTTDYPNTVLNNEDEPLPHTIYKTLLTCKNQEGKNQKTYRGKSLIL